MKEHSPDTSGTNVVGAHLLTTDQLAEHLQCSRAYVHILLNRGIPSLKLGRARRFRLDLVDAWIDENFTVSEAS